MKAIVGENFINQKETVGLEGIDKLPLWGIYFSAQWCKPCTCILIHTSYRPHINSIAKNLLR